jgi:hypothetical protein
LFVENKVERSASSKNIRMEVQTSEGNEETNISSMREGKKEREMLCLQLITKLSDVFSSGRRLKRVIPGVVHACASNVQLNQLSKSIASEHK